MLGLGQSLVKTIKIGITAIIEFWQDQTDNWQDKASDWDES